MLISFLLVLQQPQPMRTPYPSVATFNLHHTINAPPNQHHQPLNCITTFTNQTTIKFGAPLPNQNRNRRYWQYNKLWCARVWIVCVACQVLKKKGHSKNASDTTFATCPICVHIKNVSHSWKLHLGVVSVLPNQDNSHRSRSMWDVILALPKKSRYTTALSDILWQFLTIFEVAVMESQNFPRRFLDRLRRSNF